MAYGYATSAWGRVKGRVRQWESTHGRKVPPSVLREWLNAELEAEAGKAQESRRMDIGESYNKDVLDLKRQELESGRSLREQELAQRAEEVGAQRSLAEGQLEETRKGRELREKEFTAQLELEKTNQGRADELMKQQQKAATVQGIAGIAQTGIGLYSIGKDLELWGKKPPTEPTTTPTTTPSTAQTQVKPTTSPTMGLTETLEVPAGAGAGAGLAAATAVGEGWSGTLTAPTYVAPTYSLGVDYSGLAAGRGEAAGAGGAGGAGLSTLGVVAYAGMAGSIFGGFASRTQWVQDLTPWGGKRTEGAMAGAGAGVAIGAYAWPAMGPWGMVIGGVVGGVGGWYASKAICTELNRQGYLSDDVLMEDQEYAVKYISPDVYVGYRILADPVVRLMQRSKLFTQIVRPFGVAFAYESANRINPKYKGSLLGKIIFKVGIPLCRMVYEQKVKRILREAKNDMAC